MPIPRHLAARLKNRDSALKRKKELLSHHPVHVERPPKKAVPVSAPADDEPIPPRIAAVRMQGEAILTLTVPEAYGPQHLARSLRQCVDLYLQVAQCGTREIVLLWPGTLECLPLIHAIATIECWAQGYKQGLRAVLYPATNATFRRLNHVFVDREDVHTMNNEVREVSFEGINPAVKQKCQQKDLMLFALNSLKENAKKAGLQPCLNELLPHFLLETGERNEIGGQNYGDTYISHILTKLSKQGHARALRESTLPELGAAAVAPDAVFALSYRMKKAEIETALLSLKAVGPPNVVLLDATRLAFERVDKLQNRVAAFVSLVDKVFGDKGPGILIVTNDPRQMTILRATLARESKDGKTKTRFGATHGLCHPGQKNDLGLRSASSEPPLVIADASISVAITDRESAHLIGEAVRIRREKGAPAEVIEALAAVSKFVNRMANLPSSSELLQKWLDESAADDAQRRTFDWVAQRNRVKALLGDLETGLRGRILRWIEQVNVLLESQHQGTPLARAMVDQIKTRPGREGKVLVVVQSRFYADLAREYFLRDPDSERLLDRVQFTSIRMMEEKLSSNGPTHVIACALSPELLRWAITSTTLPGPLDFLLTQQTAEGASYALEPILGYDSFKPYYSRVHALYDPISRAKGAINAIIPNFDYQAPAFSLSTDGVAAGGHGERGPSDWVEIEIEDGRRILRGRGARVYIYDPAARESRALGFRVDDAENLKKGNHIFVMSEEMREEVEATFAAAGVTFDEARKYETTLRQYHAQVLQKVRERFAGSVAEAARAIGEAMAKHKVTQEAQNVRYWINLKHAERTPFDELMPQAPRHFATFKVFMEVLGFDGVEIQVFWDGAVKRVRGTRISDGLNLGDRYDRVLFDPDAAATYDGLTAGALHALRAGALDNVFEVTQVSLGTATTTPRRTRAEKIEEQVLALSPEDKQALIKRLRDEVQDKTGRG